MIQMLNMLARFELKPLGFGSSDYIHLLTEVMRRAYADRGRWLGDPDFYEVPVEGLISRSYADERGVGIDLDQMSDVGPGVPPGAKESDDTTHFSIIDKDGNAVSCTTTINSTFGSCCVADGCGFFLNNEMDDFSAKPGVPNQFGLIGGKANAIAPGKRMLSSMTPTIVCKDGELRYVIGAPGGGRIITAVMQVLLNVIDHGMPLQRAVEAPRVHHQWLPDHIQWEALSLPGDVRRALAAKGPVLIIVDAAALFTSAGSAPSKGPVGPHGTRPNVQPRPYTPQAAAGIRMLPPPSNPMATGTRPTATATADPLLDPPG